MELWRKVWRIGVVPLLSDKALEALRIALETNDHRLIQGATTVPPPLMCVSDWPVEGACAIGYCGWVGDGLKTVGETEEFFSRMCIQIDNNVGEPAGCRHFLNQYDDWTREEMRRELLPEIVWAIESRM